MIRLAKGFIFFALLIVAGAGAALPAEVDFAGLTPSPGGCTTAGGDPGSVCANTQSFSAIGNTFTATGFNNPFDPGGGGALTLSANGLGENQTGPGTACSSVDCGIAHLFGVGVVASGNPINDAIITGVDPGETFNFFAGPAIGGTFINTFDSTCTGPVAGTCLITGFGDAATIAVEMNTEGTIFVAAVSANPSNTVPEPSTWGMLLLGFAGLGYAGFRQRRKSVSLANV
jgi:PEP-CTERM motif